MSDQRHSDCASPLVPALIGGILGAGLADASGQQDAARMREEIARLAKIEAARLAEEKQRHRLAEIDSQRNATEHAYRRTVLWLEHSNNSERLAYLIDQHRAALTTLIAERIVAQITPEPLVSPRIASFAQERATLHHSRIDQKELDHQLVRLRKARWSPATVFIVGTVTQAGVFTVLYQLSIPNLLPWAFGALGLLALISPVIAQRQPVPEQFRPADAQTLPVHLDRLDLIRSLRAREITMHEQQLYQHRAELLRFLNESLATPLTKAILHAPALRATLENHQKTYPPRVRCDLATIADTDLVAPLRGSLPAALTARLEKSFSAP